MSNSNNSLTPGIVGSMVTLASSVLAVILSYVLKENRVFEVRKSHWLDFDDKFAIISAFVIGAGLVSTLIYFICYKKKHDIVASGKYDRSVYNFPTGGFIGSLVSTIIIIGIAYVIFASTLMPMAVISMACICVGVLISYFAFKFR